jgi:hypothetical protein
VLGVGMLGLLASDICARVAKTHDLRHDTPFLMRQRLEWAQQRAHTGALA